MNSNTKLGLTCVGIVVVLGIALFWWRAPADVRMADLPKSSALDSVRPSSATAATPTDAQSTKTSPSKNLGSDAEAGHRSTAESADGDSRRATRNASDSGVRDHLEAEAQLLGPTVTLPDKTQTRAIDSRTLVPVLKGEGFDSYLDALAQQASQEPLAVDLTELYSISASDAAKSVEGVNVHRVVCGMKICLASVTAPSRDAFAPWFEAFLKNPSAQPHGLGRYDNELPDGTFEFRLFFSTDQSTNSNYHSSGK